MTPRVRLLCAGLLTTGFCLLAAASAVAHPLGNFTVNRYSDLRMQPGRVEIDYVVDMAEIPAFQTRQEIDADSDGTVRSDEAISYRTTECRRMGDGVRLLVDRQPTILAVDGSDLSFPPGAAGLPTLRLTCHLDAPLEAPADGIDVDYADRNSPDRIGWREITAVADGGVMASANVPAASVSRGLTSYPEDMLQSPLDQRQAHLRFRPGDAIAAPRRPGPASLLGPLPRGADRATQAFTSLVASKQLTFPFVLLAFALAMLLGALHALSPGHGKTVMAAYLVGLQGSIRQALAIGVTVTVTHTAGVLTLGLLLSAASSAFVPDRLYPWLSLASGLLLASVGVGLLVRVVRRRGHKHTRDHRHPHPHLHAAHPHPAHDHRDGPAPETPPIGWRSLVALGLADGLVPTPSALLVLLAATALGRAWLGVVLVVAYGVGMAVTLTGTGLLLVHLRATLDRGAKGRRAVLLQRLGRLAPLTTAGVVLAVGVLLAARAAAQL